MTPENNKNYETIKSIVLLSIGTLVVLSLSALTGRILYINTENTSFLFASGVVGGYLIRCIELKFKVK